MGEIRVRPAEKKDASLIAKVHVKTWQCAYKGQMPDKYLDRLSVEERTLKWEKILSDPLLKSQTFVAELDGKVIGFCSVGVCRENDMDRESTGELYSIYVDPDSMNKGAGSELLKNGSDYLRKNGYKKAVLWVLTSNANARSWYEGKGWVVEGKTKVDKSEGFDLHETRYVFNFD